MHDPSVEPQAASYPSVDRNLRTAKGKEVAQLVVYTCYYIPAEQRQADFEHSPSVQRQHTLTVHSVPGPALEPALEPELELGLGLGLGRLALFAYSQPQPAVAVAHLERATWSTKKI